MPIAPGFPFALRQALKHTDLLVHHAPFPLTDIGLLLPVPHQVGLIVHWHANLVRSPVLVSCLAPLLRHSLQRADRVIVAHESHIENSSLLRSYSEKCITIPYGIDDVQWSTLDAPQKEEVSKLKNRYPRLVVSTGRLVSYKGFDILLQALQRINATLILIGAGPLEGRLRRQAQELGLHDRAIFVGYQTRNAMKVLFHAARVFAFPSVTSAEAFGIVQLEAMAAGLPVVNTALPTAVPHVARNEIEGLTVSPGNATALANALARLLDDDALAGQFGRAAQARVRTSFSLSAFLLSTKRIYKEVISERRSGHS